MFGRECCEIVHLAIDDNPAVVCGGVLVDLRDRDLGVRHISNAVMAASTFCNNHSQYLILVLTETLFDIDARE
jgi:hypothetical protein